MQPKCLVFLPFKHSAKYEEVNEHEKHSSFPKFMQIQSQFRFGSKPVELKTPLIRLVPKYLAQIIVTAKVSVSVYKTEYS
jgi:hypothetical protein